MEKQKAQVIQLLMNQLDVLSEMEHGIRDARYIDIESPSGGTWKRVILWESDGFKDGDIQIGVAFDVVMGTKIKMALLSCVMKYKNEVVAKISEI